MVAVATARHSSQIANRMNRQRLSLLDCAFKLLDDARSPQDFTLILCFLESPDIAALQAGARSARKRYRTSGSHLKRQAWVYHEPRDELEIVSTSEPRQAIERFIDRRFDPRRSCPVRQVLILDRRGHATLVTRFHHAAADGLSAAMWLGHQLSVAYGVAVPDTPPADLFLRTLQSSVRRSKFAYPDACDRLWTTNFRPTGNRRWITDSFPSVDLQRACRRAGGLTYSDLLATCALEVFHQWNCQHSDNGDSKIGLWLPMNIRRQWSLGFGNGTSRIRLYARYPAAASLIEKAREVRRQVSWTTKHGEWVVPEIPLFTHLPAWVTAPLLRGYLKHPSVDMATGVFSHAERWMGDAGEAFKHLERIECIGLLHPRQCLAINGVTHRGQTSLTFTYDSGLLHASDAQQLGEMYAHQIALAREELL
jgi:hypothetical protein